MAFTEDLELFFDEEDGFAVPAIFTVDGTDRSVSVIFNDPTQAIEIYGVEIEAGAPSLVAQEDNLDGVRRGTSVEVNNVEYRVERVRASGTGTAIVFLSA